MFRGRPLTGNEMRCSPTKNAHPANLLRRVKRKKNGIDIASLFFFASIVLGHLGKRNLQLEGEESANDRLHRPPNSLGAVMGWRQQSLRELASATGAGQSGDPEKIKSSSPRTQRIAASADPFPAAGFTLAIPYFFRRQSNARGTNVEGQTYA